MKRNVCAATIDRLIALASDEKPTAPKTEAALPQEKRGLELPQGARGLETMPLLPESTAGVDDNPMLKTLLQYRMLMPYMTRMMEPQNHGDPALGSLTTDLKQSVGDLQLAQRDLRLTVQDQLVQMKRVEEEMNRTREATERNASEASELVEDMKSMRSLVRKAAAFLGTMLAALVVLVIWLLIRTPHPH